MASLLNTRTELVDVDTLTPHPENPNQGDVGAIAVSIEEHGFFGTVLVQESTGTILAGEHRWQAARSLGILEIPVTFVDVDDDQARRILLVDNRTARIGLDDPNALATLLTTLAGTDTGLVGTGYDGDDLDQILSDLMRDDPIDFGDPDEDQDRSGSGNGERPQTYDVVIPFATVEERDQALELLRDSYPTAHARTGKP
ncbi:MAG: ParB N-terminal domain-containing protein [Actinomycetota bacterium]